MSFLSLFVAVAFASTVQRIEGVSMVDAPPVMLDIAQCESGQRQFYDDGSVVYNRKSGDYGIFQINKSHLREARSMGLDVIHSAEDNIAYALFLYKREGTAPWNASKGCWEGLSAP